MNRLIILILLFTFNLLANGLFAQNKLNLIFILTDEQRYDTSLPYGNDKIKTPNFNKLGAEGIVFKNAYVTQPVCSPARASIMTGLFPHTNGVVTNNIDLPESVKTLPEMLGDGYTKAYMGKWHLGRELEAWQGFDVRVSTEDYYTKDDPARNSDYHYFLVENGHKPDYHQTFSRTFASNLEYEYSKTKFIEDKAVQFLEDHQDDPFILYLSFLEPHDPNNGPFNALHDTSLVDLDSTYYMPTSREQPLRHHIGKGYDYDDGPKKMFAKYWGLVHQVDISVGVVLKKLEELGLDENTIIVFTSEHGKMLGKFGLTAKTVMYEASARVPWMMKVPGVQPKVIEDRVSHIDLVPTLLDALGQSVPSHLQGKSLMPLVRGVVEGNDPVFVEWNPLNIKSFKPSKCPDWASHEECQRAYKATTRTVVTQDGWKLNWTKGDKSQLFDLNSDPMEVKNLYYDPEYRNKIFDLQAKILQWQLKTNDITTF